MYGFVVNNYNDKKLIDLTKRLFDIDADESDILRTVMEKAWERTMICFSRISNPRFNHGGVQIYHSVQYTMYLYFLENEIYVNFLLKQKEVETAQRICDKLFMTRFQLSGMDLYYGQKMPDIWLAAHTSGVVFSPKAEIGDFFMFIQGSGYKQWRCSKNRKGCNNVGGF